MTKFHISKHGMPAPCKAEKRNCPYGGEESHFNSLEEAQEFIDKKNEERYGLLNSVDERRKMDKHDREKEVADIPGYKKTDEEYDSKDLIEKVQTKGFIAIDDADDPLYYTVILVNDTNIKDMTNKFKSQLIEEGLYNNSYIGIITNKLSSSYSMDLLPIYGSSSRYVTKWFASTFEAAIKNSLRDKQLSLLKRARNYLQINKGDVSKMIRIINEDNNHSVDQDSIDDIISLWLKEIKRSGTTSKVRRLLQSSPNKWERIYDEIIKRVESGQIKSSEDLEYYLGVIFIDTNY